ncbi:MAG: nucleoside recognition domain-containing protein [Bacillota bacterium]
MARAREWRASLGENIQDRAVCAIYRRAETVAARVVRSPAPAGPGWEALLDDLLTSPLLGYPAMLVLLGLVFWLTLAGANVPSELLAALFAGLEEKLTALCHLAGVPAWVHGLLVLGVYRTTAWVVAVMLPPMAIFFPLFTLLEDLGYLPRVAFNLDRAFRRAGTQGKQALTMGMGFGCNAAGVVACRIIDSPRERRIALLTNVFTPCNGRFPTLIVLAGLLAGGSLAAAGIVAGLVLAGILATFAVSWLLARTLLRGTPSSFALELPPYRPPQVGRILVRSLCDRTLVVLRRAVTVAAPAGAVTWLLGNTHLGGASLLAHVAGLLDPCGRLLGLDGFILAAFLLGLPANEIVLPILLMGYLGSGAMVEVDSLAGTGLREVLLAHGWTWLTVLNTMLFSLLHYPCATTLLTIRRETGSRKWTILAALIPTVVAAAACFFTARVARLLGLA